MPCFLFTYHAYGTWLPDRADGYVHWREGLQPRDDELAKAYQQKMRLAATSEAQFEQTSQELLVDELQRGARFQQFRLHAVATELTHVHAILSWSDERRPAQLSEAMKKSLSLRLTREIAKRKWLAKGGSMRQVKNQEHFDYLTKVYLPSHGGWN